MKYGATSRHLAGEQGQVATHGWRVCGVTTGECCLDRLNSQRPTLRKSRCQIRLYRDLPGNPAGGMVVRDARSLARRSLCLADPVAECPGESQRSATDEGASQRPGQRPDLWSAACLARCPGRRGLPWPTSDRAADATGGGTQREPISGRWSLNAGRN